MEAIILGTAAMAPLPGRGLSSLAVRCDPTGELLLFDCGEATQVQFRRADLSWNRVSRIFLSHTHADHVTGLPGLLMLMSQCEREAELEIYGPAPTVEYLRSMSILQPHLGYPITAYEIDSPGVLVEGEGYTVSCEAGHHRRPCYGFRVQGAERPGQFDADAAGRLGIPDGPERAMLVAGQPVRLPDGTMVEPERVVGPTRPGPSVVYITDTVPVVELVELARECTLLVCEGLYGPGHDEGAAEKMHMTIAEAAQLATEAKARMLRTVHISQRYTDDDLPELDTYLRDLFAEGAVGRDLERIPVTA